jgi:hypothetical protein
MIMNIKTTLFTLVIGSIVCLSTLPVQAESWRSSVEKQNRSNRQNQHGDRDDYKSKFKRADKERSGKPSQTQPLRNKQYQTQPLHDRTRRDRDNKREWDRERPRADDRKPIIHYDKGRHDKPRTWREKVRQTKPLTRIKRPKHRIIYRDHIKRKYRYIQGPWYYTRYLRPFPLHFHPLGYRINILPSPYVRLVISGLPYFYYSGVYYRPYNSGYIVVSAPIGAFVSSLPEGFIAFTIGLATYYFINDAYYVWDDVREGYVVVEKPDGADEAIKKATSERLMVYPNQGQNEEQQAKDRYECHRWAVTQSGIDPTLEEQEYTTEDNDAYRRAISACLEGRGYTVK